MPELSNIMLPTGTSRRRMLMLGTASLAVVVLVLGYSIWRDSSRMERQRLALVQGERLYASHCASCHGVDLQGEPMWRSPKADGTLKAPPHDDSGHTWHHDDQTLIDIISDGGQAALNRAGITSIRSGMPGFSGQLTPVEISEVLAFIKSRWSPRMQEQQRLRSQAR